MGSDPAAAAKEEKPILIVDSGAVIGLARGDKLVRSYLEEAIEEGFNTVVPPVVITETTRGGPNDARVNQVLKAFDEVSTIDEGIARQAGKLLGRASSQEIIDALIVASAIELGATRIVTSDPEDIKRLAADHPDVTILEVERSRPPIHPSSPAARPSACRGSRGSRCGRR